MATTLQILPTRTAGATGNMAIDFLLLQRYPQATAPRFRHYAWRAPACTFGYAQKIGLVRQQLEELAGPEAGRLEICRRPTGGGIVDHRDDWTYALVIPRGHPLEEMRATQSYRVVHEAMAGALQAQGVDCVAKDSRDDQATASSEGPPSAGLAKEGVCFQRAEIHDVVDARSGAKIAGAAQKRNKFGLLVQGSIWRPAAGAIDWDEFEREFTERLATALGAGAVQVPWPELNEDEVSALEEHYSSREWLEFR